LETLQDRIATLERAHRAADEARQRVERRFRAWQWTLGVFALGGLLLAIPHSGQADDQTGGLPALEKRVQDLETVGAAQTQRITALETSLTQETAARQAADQALQNALNTETSARQAADATLQSALTGEATARQAGDTALQNQVNPLVEKLSHFTIESIDGYYSVVLTAANFHLRNGLGATNGNPGHPDAVDPGQTATNGLGNLIIGYDEFLFRPQNHSGSHSLVVGAGHTYSSFGGLVAGSSHWVTAPYASVSGGLNNTATGAYASVSGGYLNTASGWAASVTGGEGNYARGIAASVTGGLDNGANGRLTSISGGYSNHATGESASVSGGSANNADGAGASVSGGFNRSAPNQNNWAAGALFQAN
jgi:hypothetical protein